MKLKLLPVLIGAAAILGGCNIINPSEPVPTYISIDSAYLKQTDPSKTGSLSSNISSVWVYYNNSTVGVFDVPGKIPVIADKAGQIQLKAGVAYSGIKNYNVSYPFYSFDTFAISPQPGGVIHHTFKPVYIDAARFRYIENFDLGSTFIKANSDNTSDTSLVRTSDPTKVFEGSGAGYIYLTTARPTSENINNDGFPIALGESFLEINYKCDVDFQIGLQTNTSGNLYVEYIAGVNPSSEWKKLYVPLGTFTAKYKGSEYRVMLKTELTSGKTDGYVLVDNIKVISY